MLVTGFLILFFFFPFFPSCCQVEFSLIIKLNLQLGDMFLVKGSLEMKGAFKRAFCRSQLPCDGYNSAHQKNSLPPPKKIFLQEVEGQDQREFP